MGKGENKMSKFKVRNCVTVDIPKSFRRDLQDLCDEVEADGIINIEDVISLILEANPNSLRWSNSDESLIINFIEEE